MNVLLNCDDALEALTSGRDAAREDEALQEHLEWCAECRQFANATEPATSLFADVLRGDDFDRQDATSLAADVLTRFEAEKRAILVASHQRSLLSLTPHAWSQLGAAAAILLALGTLFWAVSPRDDSFSHQQALLPPFSSSLASASMPEAHGLLHLASLGLPEACLTLEAGPKSSTSRQCCTRCHHAGDVFPTTRIVAFSQATCTACHKS